MQVHGWHAVLAACLREVSCCAGHRAGVAARLSEADTEARTAQLTFAELADACGPGVALPAVLGRAVKELQSIAVSLSIITYACSDAGNFIERHLHVKQAIILQPTFQSGVITDDPCAGW